MGVSRPARRDIGTVAHHPGRSVIRERVPGAAARLAPVVGRAAGHVLEVGLGRQRARHLLLHRHVAEALAGLLGVGPVVVGVPEARVHGEPPGPPLQRPGERRRAPAVQHGPSRRRIDRPSRHQDAVADGADRPARSERVDRHLLDLAALEIAPHAARPVTARQDQRVVGAAACCRPVQRRSERGVLAQRAVRGAGRRVGAQEASRRPSPVAAPGTKPQGSRPWPVTMRSSASPIWPEGVAKRTSCPAAESTCQLTATSVGSKSQAGIGMSTVAMAPQHTTEAPKRRPGHRSRRRLRLGRMTDTDAATDTAGSEQSTQDFQQIFSPDDPLDVLWVKAYQGEVLGEALFDRMADQIDDEEHKSQDACPRHARTPDQGVHCTRPRARRAVDRARSRVVEHGRGAVERGYDAVEGPSRRRSSRSRRSSAPCTGASASSTRPRARRPSCSSRTSSRSATSPVPRSQATRRTSLDQINALAHMQ